MSPLELRLALKDRGYSPIPCAGKRPVLDEWQNKLDASVEEIARWPGGNTGILTGTTTAFDVDIMHPDAAAAVESMVRDWFDGKGVVSVRFGNAPKRAMLFRTVTPFAKMVSVFSAPNGDRHKIEVLGNGQQIIVAGINPDANVPYTWHGPCPWVTPRDELPELTEAEAHDLLELTAAMLQEQFGFARTSANGAGEPIGGDGARDVGDRPHVDVDEALGAMRFEDGDQGVHETQLRCTASLLRSGVVLDEVVEQVLGATRAAVAGDARTSTWNWETERLELERMCFDFIKKNPELADVLPDEFRDQFVQAYVAGRQPWFAYNRAVGKWHVRAKHVGADTFTRATGYSGQASNSVIEARPFVRFDPATLPAREWLYGGHYQRGIITATVGPGGGGKSSLNLVELVAVCTGRSLVGEQPSMRCRAWYHNAEDPLDEIYRRLAAVCQHYTVSQDDLDGWLFVTSGLDMPIKIATSRAGTVHLDPTTTAAIIKTIADNEIGIASFDPLIAHHAAAENATGDMDQVVREFARIANATECSIEIVHHTRKPAPGQEELSVVDSRGASAIINAVRSARVLNPMSKTEADKASIDDVDRRLHFRVDKGKANMAPPTAARWHKFVGVELPNGDDVGVATEWLFPGQGSPMAEEANKTADKVFLQLLVRLTMQGRKVSSSPGANYAPNVFSKEREAKAAKIGKSALGDAMRRLFDEGRIQVEHDGAGSHRSSRIVVAIP